VVIYVPSPALWATLDRPLLALGVLALRCSLWGLGSSTVALVVLLDLLLLDDLPLLAHSCPTTITLLFILHPTRLPLDLLERWMGLGLSRMSFVLMLGRSLRMALLMVGELWSGRDGEGVLRLLRLLDVRGVREGSARLGVYGGGRRDVGVHVVSLSLSLLLSMLGEVVLIAVLAVGWLRILRVRGLADIELLERR
jgi:hypothetical protein